MNDSINQVRVPYTKKNINTLSYYHGVLSYLILMFFVVLYTDLLLNVFIF